MTSFVISTPTETAQSLADLEFGVVTTSGFIVDLVQSAAISAAGSYRLNIDGMVMGNLYGVSGAASSSGRISIGSNGYVSGDQAGIYSSSATVFQVNNAGDILGGN